MSHPNIVDGWFKETSTFWPGQALTLEVIEILHMEQSLFQDVLVFKSRSHGNVLVLDGVIQVTELDEFAYQEMITHLPMNAHPNPQHVLIIGGGDGGVLREVVKHPEVVSVTLVEIDEAVPRVSKQFLPKLAVGFDHPKVSVQICDGFKYLQENKGRYDVIITDSSDPVGPAESLFQDGFYGLLRDALRPGGVVCAQGECQWLHLDLIERVTKTLHNFFPVVSYAWASVPTYPCGNMGFLITCNDQSRDLSVPLRKLDAEALGLKYYDSDVHKAAFVLPVFARKRLAGLI